MYLPFPLRSLCGAVNCGRRALGNGEARLARWSRSHGTETRRLRGWGCLLAPVGSGDLTLQGGVRTQTPGSGPKEESNPGLPRTSSPAPRLFSAPASRLLLWEQGSRPPGRAGEGCILGRQARASYTPTLISYSRTRGPKHFCIATVRGSSPRLELH